MFSDRKREREQHTPPPPPLSHIVFAAFFSSWENGGEIGKEEFGLKASFVLLSFGTPLAQERKEERERDDLLPVLGERGDLFALLPP